MLLHVGQPMLHGDLGRYAQRFDLLELRAEQGKLPRLARLRQWRSQVPENFVFSVVLPQMVSGLETSPEASAAIDLALGAVEALQAAWIVMQTPASVTPSTRSRQRLAALVERLPRDRLRVAWEPRGVWQDDEAERASDTLGVHLVRDVSRSPAPHGNVVYSRMRGLGDASRVRVSAVERVAERLSECEQGFVVIEGEGAVRAAALLRQLVVEGAAEGFVGGDDLEADEDVSEQDDEEDLDDELAEDEDR
jgi:uncharacterized protein YecE (DUF72 family)